MNTHTYVHTLTHTHTRMHAHTQYINTLTLSDTSLQPLFSQRWYHPSVAVYSTYIRICTYNINDLVQLIHIRMYAHTIYTYIQWNLCITTKGVQIIKVSWFSRSVYMIKYHLGPVSVWIMQVSLRTYFQVS